MSDIDKLHEVSLKMLKEVDRVCKKNNVEYFLGGGTLLGAVRHQGFIPWDDDVDLLIKRENLGKFFEACRKDLNPDYELITMRDFNHHFFDFIPRILVKESRLRNVTPKDEFYGNMQNKIAIDIFIIDSISSNRMMQKLHVLKHKVIYGLARGHRYELDFSNYSFSIRVFKTVLSKIGKHISLEHIFRWHEKTAIKYNKKNTGHYIVSNATLNTIECIFLKEWYERTERLPFVDCRLDCPGGWKHILTLLYGDYMTLPPESERVYMHMNDSELQVGK